MTLERVIARAWKDPAYKAKLLKDPRSALVEAGVEIPAGNTVKVFEAASNTRYLVLPPVPGNVANLPIGQLEEMAMKYYDALPDLIWLLE